MTSRRRLAPFAVALALLSPALARAQEGPNPPAAQTRTISFVDALRLAARMPPTVRAALSRVASANSQIEQARAGWLPTIAVSSSPNINFTDRPFLPAVAAQPMTATTPAIPAQEAQRLQGSSFQIDATAGVRWNLFDFGRTAANDTAQRSFFFTTRGATPSVGAPVNFLADSVPRASSARLRYGARP